MSGTSFSYDELDEILRSGGHGDAVGMSAIDGLIAALVPRRPSCIPMSGCH
jgi:hypothetical protein